MNASSILDNEPARLREIGALGLAGFNARDHDLNDIIRIACDVADTPVAMANILNRPDMTLLVVHILGATSSCVVAAAQRAATRSATSCCNVRSISSVRARLFLRSAVAEARILART